MTLALARVKRMMLITWNGTNPEILRTGVINARISQTWHAKGGIYEI